MNNYARRKDMNNCDGDSMINFIQDLYNTFTDTKIFEIFETRFNLFFQYLLFISTAIWLNIFLVLFTPFQSHSFFSSFYFLGSCWYFYEHSILNIIVPFIFIKAMKIFLGIKTSILVNPSSKLI